MMADEKVCAKYMEHLKNGYSTNTFEIYQYISANPKCTAKEVSIALPTSKSVPARISDLIRHGLVEKTELKNTSSGHPARCLRAVPVTNKHVVLDAIRHVKPATNENISEYTEMELWKVGCTIEGLVKSGEIEHIGYIVDENNRRYNIWGIA